MATVMGMNLSTGFMDKPISWATGMKAINGWGIQSVKLFDSSGVDAEFIKYVTTNKSTKFALGIPNDYTPTH
jgi:hypothetical protein